MSDDQPEVKIKFVKKKGGHAAGHGGAWKVAYADLVTAMMAFFLLMWLLNSSNSNTKEGLSKYFTMGPNFWDSQEGKQVLLNHGAGILPGGRGTAPVDVGEGPDKEAAAVTAQEEQRKMEATAKAIGEAFSSDQLLQAFKDQVSMDFTDEGLRIQIQDKAAQVLFDSGSAQIKPYTLSILKEIAKELQKLPNRVAIGGHTDSAQYSTRAYTNWELSADRANAARRVMESAGMKAGQIYRVTGYADTVPMEGAGPLDPRNRRISILVLSSATEKAETERRKVKRDAGGEKPAAKTAKDPETLRKEAGDFWPGKK